MAARTLEQAVAINPDDPNILLTLGEIYREEREYELARDAYRKSYELDPSLEAAAIGLGTCCAHLGLYAEASEIIRRSRQARHPLRVDAFRTHRHSGFVRNAELANGVRSKDGAERKERDAAEFAAISRLSFRAAISHKAGRHAEAWEQLARANRRAARACKPEMRQSSPETQRANLAQLKEKRIKRGGIERQARSPDLTFYPRALPIRQRPRWRRSLARSMASSGATKIPASRTQFGEPFRAPDF